MNEVTWIGNAVGKLLKFLVDDKEVRILSSMKIIGGKGRFIIVEKNKKIIRFLVKFERKPKLKPEWEDVGYCKTIDTEVLNKVSFDFFIVIDPEGKMYAISKEGILAYGRTRMLISQNVEVCNIEFKHFKNIKEMSL